MRGILAITSLFLAAFTQLPRAHADPVEDFYKGKQIRAIVGLPPGNDYDTWVRLLARHWGDFIPGHPTFIVQNMPGAGQIVAANYLYNIADKDGTVVTMTERSLPYQVLLGDPNLRFDPQKFNWIGSPEQTNRGCAAIEGAPVQKAVDLFTHELLMGGDGAGTSVTNTPILLAKLLGMKFKLIDGYPSGVDIVLAMEKGELGGICQTIAGLEATRPGWIKSGKFKVLFTMEHAPVPGLDVPTIYDFTKTDEQRQIIGLYDSSLELGRPIIAPPGVPADRVTALRRSFEAMMADPAFQADAKSQGYVLTLRKGEMLQSFVDQLMATPKSVIQKVKELTQ
ncbi:MAG TPA: tripartite tricarboxylate transporter substrate-binding protein [Beijerinckiaceae bacterium]|nr:tripartite tricarboxylate transporter substrate-binding protein [Beijerinckiaceae bacterium]